MGDPVKIELTLKRHVTTRN